jgi:3alpha(or 20beta)-hydroxysteroid dehydrogenase
VNEEIISGWPLGRMAAPREVAPLAVFLASEESSYCTGAEFVIDSGATAGPAYLDKS